MKITRLLAVTTCKCVKNDYRKISTKTLDLSFQKKYFRIFEKSIKIKTVIVSY